MPTWNTCGGKIEIRYIGGRPTPLHVNGGSCSGHSARTRVAATRPFETTVSYVNPNAHCPVCGEQVFYYQSPYGGRVFFDDLGWPWEKHGCTDNPRSQQAPVKLRTADVFKPFRNAAGEPLDIYELKELKEKDGVLRMRFSRIGANMSFSVSLPAVALRMLDITTADLKLAPSFVVRSYETSRVIEFISGRKKGIDRFKAQRSHRSG
ncbi:hypothetical protein [Mesorhizobium sp.]|uniref:hypothetical protein n=1 Tax=Mesorhizobium sp. TaxID=1871066 RepID=UPI0011F869A9|nr:hypothetical protein [Mesorhizobium sp.]TIV61843.1 MAG: hypothetical protein E5V80_02625 [Mesorhizobium sp.]